MNDIPLSYKKIACKPFPKDGFKNGDAPSLESIGAFYEALMGAPFPCILQAGQDSKTLEADFEALLDRFYENMTLIIAKTWVEKDDEERKEKLLARLPRFMALLRKADYNAALQNFKDMIRELAYLLFGEQSERSDFHKLAFRIDPQIGLFFWYGFHLGVFEELFDKEASRSILLIGLMYLADF